MYCWQKCHKKDTKTSSKKKSHFLPIILVYYNAKYINLNIANNKNYSQANLLKYSNSYHKNIKLNKLYIAKINVMQHGTRDNKWKRNILALTLNTNNSYPKPSKDTLCTVLIKAA